jgi:antitoxin CcdA
MNIQQTRRKATNVSVDPALVAEAKAEGINLSRVLETGLAAELKRVREERWLEENREAIEAWNVWMEENELPLAQYRQI